jgi:hypothetical protein
MSRDSRSRWTRRGKCGSDQPPRALLGRGCLQPPSKGVDAALHFVRNRSTCVVRRARLRRRVQLGRDAGLKSRATYERLTRN